MMNSRTKILLTVGVGLLLSAAALFFGIRPLLDDVRQLNLTLGQKQAELNKIERQIVEFKSAQTDLARATSKNNVYDAIPVREDLSLVIQDLETAAGKTGTTESIQISEQEAQQQTGNRRLSREESEDNIFENLTLSDEVRYTMNLSDDYTGTIQFLQYLENLPHFTEFDRLTFNAVVQGGAGAEEINNTGVVTGSLEGVFLVKKNAQPKK